MNPLLLSPELYRQLRSNRSVRIRLARASHRAFFALYLPHYLTHSTAPFHRELFTLTEDETIKHAVVVAFRNSGKTTLMTVSYPIWSIIGVQQRKFVLILSQTQAQAKQHMVNLRQELETNDLLRANFGAFEEDTDQWGLGSVFLRQYGARIIVASSEQSMRGLRNRQFRPDLIVCDDVEDLNSVKTKEGRDRTYAWLTGEILPAGDKNTKVVTIGSLLHEDSLLMRLKRNMENGQLDGVFKWIPLVNTSGAIAWPGKFPDQASIEALKRTVGSESAWQREFLLHIIADQEQIVHPSWIHRYKEFPKNADTYRYTGTGIDLAVAQKETADYCAMVTAKVYGSGEQMRIYILPHSINKRMVFPDQVDQIKLLAKGLKSELYIEDVGYQLSIIQQLERDGFRAVGVKVYGQDKRARLATITHLVQNGQILFPEHGCEELITQLTGFGVETHDDLADAFAILIHKILEKGQGKQFKVMVLGDGGFSRDILQEMETFNRGGPFFGRNQVF